MWEYCEAKKRKEERQDNGGYIIGIKKGWGSERNKVLREEGDDIVISEIRNKEEGEGKEVGAD